MTVDTFRIDLPALWQEVPTDASALRLLVAERSSGEEWAKLTATQRRRVELFVERIAIDMQRTDTKMAAVFVQVFDVEEGDEPDDGGVLMATVTVSTLDRAQMGSTVPLTAEVVQASMSLQRPDDAASTGPRTTNLEVPEVVALPVGNATKVVRLVELGRAPQKLTFFTETYFVPVAPEYEQLLVLQFATPNVADARIFSELFGEIARTIQMYHEGQPTTL